MDLRRRSEDSLNSHTPATGSISTPGVERHSSEGGRMLRPERRLSGGSAHGAADDMGAGGDGGMAGVMQIAVSLEPEPGLLQGGERDASGAASAVDVGPDRGVGEALQRPQPASGGGGVFEEEQPGAGPQDPPNLGEGGRGWFGHRAQHQAQHGRVHVRGVDGQGLSPRPAVTVISTGASCAACGQGPQVGLRFDSVHRAGGLGVVGEVPAVAAADLGDFACGRGQ